MTSFWQVVLLLILPLWGIGCLACTFLYFVRRALG